MAEDLIWLEKRFIELADRSYTQNMYTFTDFLGLSEQNLFWQKLKELSYAAPELYGGYEGADRCMIRFGKESELGYTQEFPIVCIHIRPLMAKFADSLSHRDFLGALMNLGIERATMGDIQCGEHEAYLFCQETIAEYICDNLTQVKHTSVKCEIVENMGQVVLEEPQEKVIQVASGRIDAVIAKVYSFSRSEVLEYFREGKVFLNGRVMTKNAVDVTAGDVVNVRGFGKFKVTNEGGLSRKGKVNLTVAVYR